MTEAYVLPSIVDPGAPKTTIARKEEWFQRVNDEVCEGKFELTAISRIGDNVSGDDGVGTGVRDAVCPLPRSDVFGSPSTELIDTSRALT